MKKFNKTVTVYELGEGFFAEVSKQGEAREFYLYHNDYSIKQLMFALVIDDSEEESYLVNIDSYIDFYREQYMED